MKLFILLFFIQTTSLLAVSRPHLVCLGQEEVNIHKKKDTGPYYKLNQEMISTMLQLNETIQIKNQYLKEICEASNTSFKILELIFSHNGDIFISTAAKNNIQVRSMDKFSIDELKARSFKVLINFLTRQQALYTDPHCLKKKVPEILSFYENATYLLSEIGIENTIKTIANKKVFFKNLKNLPKRANCKN
jgi:hypothetical protein